MNPFYIDLIAPEHLGLRAQVSVVRVDRDNDLVVVVPVITDILRDCGYEIEGFCFKNNGKDLSFVASGINFAISHFSENSSKRETMTFVQSLTHKINEVITSAVISNI